MERQIVELEQRLIAVSALKEPTEVARVSLPADHKERLDALVTRASKALQKLRPIVREAIRWDVLGDEMPWPDGFDDQGAQPDAQKAYDAGELLDGSRDGTLVPDYEFSKASAAHEAIEELMTFLRKEAEPAVRRLPGRARHAPRPGQASGLGDAANSLRAGPSSLSRLRLASASYRRPPDIRISLMSERVILPSEQDIVTASSDGLGTKVRG